MKLWLLQQEINKGYDTYDSCVVVAETESAAKNIHPCFDFHNWMENSIHYNDLWAHPNDISAVCLGEALPGLQSGVICASFNAG